MEATVVGENEDGIGVDIVDNNGVAHELTIRKESNEIVYHQSEEYADNPEHRSREENEYNNQARRYAKWYVYRERGYDTVPPANNPDRLVGAMLSVLNSSDEAFQEQFGTLQKQVQRHSDGNPVKLPFGNISAEDTVVYRQDIWLDTDPTTFEPPLLEQYLDAASDSIDTISRALSDEPLPHETLPSVGIEAVSDVHYLYTDGFSQETHRDDPPLDRDPDAQLELLPLDIGAFGSFELMIVSHLGFQIRDCFLDMGSEPPEMLAIEGPGKYESMVKQQLMSMYDTYFQPGGALSSTG